MEAVFRRLNGTDSALMIVFGCIGLMLAAIGVSGITAYAVEQRRREIGIRMAIGAAGSTVERMVVLSSLRYAVVGIGAGVVCAMLLGRTLRGFLFGVRPLDPSAFMVGTASFASDPANAASRRRPRRARDRNRAPNASPKVVSSGGGLEAPTTSITVRAAWRRNPKFIAFRPVRVSIIGRWTR